MRTTPNIRTARYDTAAADPNWIRRLNWSSSPKIRLLTRGNSLSTPVGGPSAAQSVIRDSWFASSISGSGDPVASGGIDRPEDAWDRL